MSEAAPVPRPAAEPQDYIQLLKPRVMSLVVFTALTGLVCAPGDMAPLTAAIAVLCIALGAGAAGALNMALEGSTDALMRRTRGRPVAAGRVPKGDALAYGVILSVASVTLLGLGVNWMAGGLLALTIVYYAGLYTLVLKRRTPQNIVIGGAAGDYAKAGIPMMPVARGAKSTRLQILIYSLVLVPVAVLPAFVGLGGMLYMAVSVAGGALFLLLAARLYMSRAGDTPDKAEAVGREAALYDVRAEAKAARNLFAYSIVYLFALFAALLVEQGLTAGA